VIGALPNEITSSHEALQLVRDGIKTYLREESIMERECHLFFEKIFNELLGIQADLPLFLEASTADAKCSRPL